MKKLNKSLIVGISLFVAFALFTILVKLVDVSAVGPLGSKVGFSSLNDAVFDAFGKSDAWYHITEALGIVALFVAAGFAVFGLVQIIKRKSLKLVDNNIFLLGIFYVVLALFYFLFEIVVINKRPILVEGELEASFPSSHTMLTVFIMGSAMIQFRKLFAEKKKLVITLDALSIIIVAVTVIGRLLSGMHWLTDVIAGLLLSLALVFIYHGVLKLIETRKSKDNQKA
ncbi:MAG: phosphatase PAP2 family protein [Clostridia bacterium]|nr:phosphatase PAP2 family protein [Clostridia bacterium]